MQTYIKRTPHFLENLQKNLGFIQTILILFKKYLFLVKQMMFIQQTSRFLFKKKTVFFMFFVKRMFGQSLFFHQQIFNHTLSGRKFPMHM